MAMESLWWWPLPCWLSRGAAGFIFFNVVVVAVAFLSWGQQVPRHRRKLTRSASSMVMERLRSFTLFSVDHLMTDSVMATPPQHRHHAQEYHTFQVEQQEEDTTKVTSMVEPEPAAVQVTGARMTATMAAPPSSSQPEPVTLAEAHAAGSPLSGCQDAEEEKPIRLDTVARRRPSPAAAATAIAAEACASAARPRRKREAVVKRRAYPEVEGKAEVNERAERFIREFREDLKLQRLNSIISYHQSATPKR